MCHEVFFRMYLPLAFKVYKMLSIDSIGFVVVDIIKKRPLVFTESNTQLGVHFSPHPTGLVRTEGIVEYF